MDRYLDLHFFVGGFAVGILAVYAMRPPMQIVHKFPSPDNVSRTLYHDAAGDTCYRYVAESAQCDANSAPQPIVEA